MENFIAQLWNSFSKLESQILIHPYKQEEVVFLRNELHKKIMELKIFLTDYQWKDSAEEAQYRYVHAPAFCSSYIFLTRLESLMATKDLMPPKAFQSFLKYQKRLMEQCCIQAFPFVVYCAMILKNNIPLSMFDNGNDCSFFVDDLYFIEENKVFGKQAIVLGKYDAFKRLLILLADKNRSFLKKEESADLEDKKLNVSLNWTDTGMSITEMAYALKYSGVINKGNVDVKEIADALAKTFNAPAVNIYRNKQDLYSRKNQSMFLDKLRRDLIRGLEESDLG